MATVAVRACGPAGSLRDNQAEAESLRGELSSTRGSLAAAAAGAEVLRREVALMQDRWVAQGGAWQCRSSSRCHRSSGGLCMDEASAVCNLQHCTTSCGCRMIGRDAS
jgi:hypothetical protein